MKIEKDCALVGRQEVMMRNMLGVIGHSVGEESIEMWMRRICVVNNQVIRILIPSLFPDDKST
jgi:hypothetical protein